MNPNFVKKNYLISQAGFYSSLAIVAGLLSAGNYLFAILALPFLLGFGGMFYSIRKDYQKSIG